MRLRRWWVLLLAILVFASACTPKEEELLDAPSGSTIAPPVQEEATDDPTPSVPQPSPEKPSGDKTPDTPTNSDEPEPDNTPTTEKQETNTTKDDKDNSMVDLSTDVRYFGRTYEQNGTYYCNWTESGFEFAFNGTGAEATFESNAVDSSHTAYIRIYIDGKESGKTVAIADAMQTVSLCKGLKKGNHTVRVVKRTNARSSALGVVDITLARGSTILPAPTAKERRIEFIGDSITVGYGTLGNGETEWSTATEDGSVTYAALTGKALNAEYNVVAISGRGLAHNTDGTTDKLMPSLYIKTDEYNNPGAAWSFTDFVPDVVVINLGTNDQATSSDAEVTGAMTAFLQTVRKHNRNAYIVVAYGMMGNQKEAALRQAISATGDNRISFLSLPKANTTQMQLWHPDQKAHKAAAEILTAEIRRLTGWK